MHKRIASILALAVILTLAGGALAGDLTEDQAKRFASSLKETKDFRDSLEESGHTALMNQAFNPKPGEKFRPFATALGALKTEAPAKHSEFEGLISSHGFSNAADWSEIGDRVILAYIALELTGNAQMMQMVQQLTPEMIQAQPPEYRGQLEAAVQIFEQIKGTSEADRAIVGGIKSELETVLNLPMGMGGMAGR